MVARWRNHNNHRCHLLPILFLAVREKKMQIFRHKFIIGLSFNTALEKKIILFCINSLLIYDVSLPQKKKKNKQTYISKKYRS